VAPARKNAFFTLFIWVTPKVTSSWHAYKPTAFNDLSGNLSGYRLPVTTLLGLTREAANAFGLTCPALVKARTRTDLARKQGDLVESSYFAPLTGVCRLSVTGTLSTGNERTAARPRDFKRALSAIPYRISQAANSRHRADRKTKNTTTTFCQANSTIGTHNDTGSMRPLDIRS
jgi:hypothetical protein